jgi:DNA-binding protein H-NS
VGGFCLYTALFHKQRNGAPMAKAVRGRRRKTAARKITTPANRKQAKPSPASDKLRALVYNLSAEELDELLKAATKRKNEEIASARASFLDEVKARAASLGMSLADLVGLGGGKADANPKGKSPALKYRNPTTGETWSGRGRPAKWITELEAKGQKREKFAV